MLKGFVSGEEKDIKRIPMKGKNLFDKSTAVQGKWLNVNTGEEENTTSAYYLSAYIPVISGQAYMFVNPNSTRRWFYDANKSPVEKIDTSIQYIPAENGFLRFTITNVLDTFMLVADSSLPAVYEPYGYQEGWEVRDNQDRLIWGREDELQTATGTLPFKGYGLPVKAKSLLGNAVQNGTPAPDNIITPEMCGVLNENLAIIESDSRTITNFYYKDIRITDQLAAGTYTFSFIYDDHTEGFAATIGRGTQDSYLSTLITFNPPENGVLCVQTVTLTEAECVWARFLRATSPSTFSYSVSSIRVEKGSSAYGWKVQFENHGENLFYSDRTKQNTTAYSAIDQTEGSSELVISKNETSSAVALSVTINLPLRAGTYTVSIDGLSVIEGNLDRINLRDSDGVIVNNVMAGSPQSFTIAADTVINAVVFVCDSTSTYTNKKVRIMLNPGSTPKPYSPYLNETLPVYLGEVPTVRRVRKRVLTGEETIAFYSTGATGIGFYISLGTMMINSRKNGYCTHFQPQMTPSGSTIDGVTFGANSNQIYFTFSAESVDAYNLTDLASIKAWLASEYSAGHPVTVWYVLANEQTGIVNEPLAKIGTYADELTAIQVHGLSAPLYGIGDYKDTLNLSTGVVTRKVKKLVLTGEEWITKGTYPPSTNCYQFGFTRPADMVTDVEKTTNSHFKRGSFTNGSYVGSLYNMFPEKSVLPEEATAADFKNWLAAQYQNGTPVTIWYVLSTPETETVTVPTGMTGEIEGYLTQVSTPTPTNRSIPKWNGVEETGGTYAVTVYTPPEIPTTTGENTLIVETEKIHGLTNPLCGIGDYKDVLNLSTGVITRKVKKLVLDGTESWNDTYGVTMVSALLNNVPFIPTITAISDRYVYNPIQSGLSTGLADGEFALQKSGEPTYGYNYNLAIKDSRYASVADLKAYLAAQYAAGTPVTVWYVLETPETETITVPYGLECSIEGYLTQSGTPSPSSPITPDSNGILESGGTYAVEVSLVPSNLTVKGHIKELT